MPQAAPRPCTQAGCGRLVRDGSGRCDKHPRELWSKRLDAPKRVTGRRLQAARARLFQREPLCVMCRDLGRVTLATERDHKIPLAEGGDDSEANEQGLCRDHHREKSLQEAIRGRRR